MRPTEGGAPQSSIANHEIPIERAGLWDVLNKYTVASRAAYAPADPREQGGKNALAVMGRELLKASQESEKQGELMLHRIASAWIGSGPPPVRRQKAGRLADAYGARPDRLIDYLAYKWGLFKRTSRSA